MPTLTFAVPGTGTGVRQAVDIDDIDVARELGIRTVGATTGGAR